MKLSNTTRLIMGIALLIAPVINLFADNTAVDLYALPKDKSPEEVCLKSVLKSHPGQVFSFNIYNDNNNFHYQYEINSKEKNWLIICDGTTNQIIKDELEDIVKSGL